jgi:hypothetical protein
VTSLIILVNLTHKVRRSITLRQRAFGINAYAQFRHFRVAHAKTWQTLTTPFFCERRIARMSRDVGPPVTPVL